MCKNYYIIIMIIIISGKCFEELGPGVNVEHCKVFRNCLMLGEYALSKHSSISVHILIKFHANI